MSRMINRRRVGILSNALTRTGAGGWSFVRLRRVAATSARRHGESDECRSWRLPAPCALFSARRRAKRCLSRNRLGAHIPHPFGMPERTILHTAGSAVQRTRAPLSPHPTTDQQLKLRASASAAEGTLTRLAHDALKLPGQLAPCQQPGAHQLAAIRGRLGNVPAEAEGLRGGTEGWG